MKILAFDTSSETLSVAVADGERVLWSEELTSIARHSDSLAPRIEHALGQARLQPRSLDLIAVGVGPGSFTGLRIGLVTAKMLAWALQKKMVGVSSLEAAARSRWRSALRVAAIVDAKRGNLYAAVYEKKSSGVRSVRKPALVEASRWIDTLRGPLLVTGSGVTAYRELLTKAAERRRFDLDPEPAKPLAVYVAEAARERAGKKKYDDPEKLLPDYLQAKDCNVTRK